MTNAEAVQMLYPRLHDRGPIEASISSVVARSASRDYPRSHDRGPIEALKPVVGSPMDWRSIRGHMTAAPLKRSKPSALDRLANSIRGHMTAAPLKPTWKAKSL